jgi:hypothetical protein
MIVSDVMKVHTSGGENESSVSQVSFVFQDNAFCNLNSYIVSFSLKYRCCYLVGEMDRLTYTIVVQENTL